MFKKIQSFSDWLGNGLAYWLSTMACFYVITCLVVIPLFFQRPNGLVPWIQYSVSVFFQGVALPVLGYVAKKGSEGSDKVTRETHDSVMAQVELLKAQLELMKNDHENQNHIMEDQNHIMEEQNVMIEDLKHILKELHCKEVE